MPRIRLHLLVAAAAAALLATTLTGCATPGAGADADATGRAPASAAPSDAVDALTLEGPAVAATVPDMTAVVSDAAPVLPSTVTDARGDAVTVTRADRVIALDLYGTLTDTLLGLGLEDRLVGRAVSDTQKALADLPVVSRDAVGVNVEAVLNLHPDVVLTNDSVGAASDFDKIAAAGVPVVHFTHTPTLAGIGDTIRAVGAVFGMGDAADVMARNTDADLATARTHVARLAEATAHRPRAVVLYIRGTGGVFFILGADYGAADVLDALRLDDAAADAGITSLKPASAEALVALDPEVILTMTDGVASAGGIDALLARPGIAATTAGSRGRVITAADAQLLSYGPRTPANLTALAAAVYTDGS